MSGNVLSTVIEIRPQRKRDVEALKAAGIEPEPASVEDSPTTCDGCGRDCWIAPSQKALIGSAFMRQLRKLCPFCIRTAVNHLGVKPRASSLDINPPGAARPRLP